MSKASWSRDEGYEGCKTARFGDIVVVICPPQYGFGWGYQAFDESDWDSVESGETYAEDYGFASEQKVMEYVEGCMAQ
jgi:hypothetical protein